MSVTAVMADLATNPLKLEEFRAHPSEALALSGLDETSAAAVFSRDPSQVRKAIAGENGLPVTMGSIIIILIL